MLNKVTRKGSDTMKKTKKTYDDIPGSSMPAMSEEGRENQLIAMAINLAEKQLREGTASSQVITHFLKLGTQAAKLEKEKQSNQVSV